MANNMISGLETIIGPIPSAMRDTYANPGETFQTGFDLTELLMNRVGPVVTSQISGLLRKSYVSPYTSLLLPMRQLGPYESTAVRWMEIHFDAGLANQVETEGVARLYQHKKTKRGARAVRRGVACRVDSMFYATPEGRDMWRKQILQLATIVQRTNEYDVLSTLLSSVKRDPQYHQNGEIGNGNNVYGLSDESSFIDRLKQRIEWFGIVNKSPDSRGFGNLCTTLRTTMRRRGVDVDALIVPPHLLGYYYFTKSDLWEAQATGPSVDANREFATELASADTGLRSMKMQGMTLVDSYVQRMTSGHGAGGDDVSDLLTVQRQIGEFYPMSSRDWCDGSNSFKEYGPKCRNVRIFNEDHSRVVNVKFSDALKNCNAWGAGGAIDVSVFDDSGFSAGSTFGDLEFNADSLKTKNMFQMIGDSFEARFSTEELSLLDDAAVGTDGSGRTYLQSQVITLANRCLPDNAGVASTADISSFLDQGESGLRPVTNLFVNIIKDGLVTKDNCVGMNDCGIYVPFDIILVRPFMQYACSSVVMMKSGSETGETLIGQQKFEMTSNVADRTLYANYFYYGKAYVRDEKNVVVAPDVFIQSYIKGNNTEFMGAEDLESIKEGGMTGEDDKHSLLAFLVPPGDDTAEKRNIIDMRGSFDQIDDGQKHFPTSDYYKDKLGIDQSTVADPVSNETDYEDMHVQLNTICCLGHVEDHCGRVIHCNTGHLGPNTGDHCDSMRKPGVYAPVVPQTYKIKM